MRIMSVEQAQKEARENPSNEVYFLIGNNILNKSNAQVILDSNLYIPLVLNQESYKKVIDKAMDYSAEEYELYLEGCDHEWFENIDNLLEAQTSDVEIVFYENIEEVNKDNKSKVRSFENKELENLLEELDNSKLCLVMEDLSEISDLMECEESYVISEAI